MNRRTKIGIILASVFLLVLLVSGNVMAHPTDQTDCSVCHSTTTGIAITAVSSLDVDAGQTFQLDVQASGRADQTNFVLKIPSDVDNNGQFTIVYPSPNGLVNDNDGSDLDTNSKVIHIIYNITAPAFAGTYTLTVYAVQNTPYGESHSITINVAQVGEGPTIGQPSTSVDVPEANQPFTVTVEVTSPLGVDYVILQYINVTGGGWHNVSMTETTEANVYTGAIPGFEKNVEVQWRIVAGNSAGESVSGISSYTVGQIPVEPIVLPQFHYGWYIGLPALVLAYVGTALEYYDEERFTKIHGMMLGVAYILTSINVISLFMEPAGTWSVMNPAYLLDISNMLRFMHAWHVWLGIISVILGTLAFITHLGGWKTCNLGLPAVVLWTILGIMGVYLGGVFVP
jgi:hypothetical protein